MQTRRNLRTRLAGVAWLFAALAPAAFAQQVTQQPVTPGFGTPVDATMLDSQCGGDGSNVNTIDVNINIDGGVDGNTAIGTISGENLIDGGSFANSAGIATVIQNSGNNVLIQNATAVTVQFLDPGSATRP